MGYDVDDIHRALAKMGHQRGPMPGGGRGPGAAWRGIVEETPVIWCSWVVAAGRASGRGVPLAIIVAGTRIPLPGVYLTYGVRYYFRCPSCKRKCEAIYLLKPMPACRKCHRLGYRCQSRRWSSVYAILGPLFDRDMMTGRGRYHVDKGLLQDQLVEAQDAIKARLLAALDGLGVEYGDDDDQVEGT